MARPDSRQALIEYTMRSLGFPVIEINIDDDQIEDRLDEALQFYQEYHSDAVVRSFVKHKITVQDIEQQYIELPDSLISVFRVFPISSGGSAGGMFSYKYQMYMNDFDSLRGQGSILDYEMTRQYLSLINTTINGIGQQITFNRHMNKLMISADWKSSGIEENNYIVLEGYQTLDPDTYTDIYNDMMLKKHFKALLKQQWGLNLIKYDGMQLPGGVTISGRAIFEDANNEISKIEEEYDLKYSLPPDFFVG